MKLNRFGDYRRNVRFLPLAGYIVHIVFSEDIVESCRQRYGHCSARESATAFVRHSTVDGRSHMFLPMTVEPGTIAHESSHVIYNMFSWVGVKDFDDEMVAYHLGYLVEQVHKFKAEVERHVSKAETPRRSATRL